MTIHTHPFSTASPTAYPTLHPTAYPATRSAAAPAVQRVILRSGLRLGYRELGDGPAVLLLHGWPTSSYLWRKVMPAIAEQNRVIALDLPGFGASDKPAAAPYDFDYFESAIDEFLTAVGVSSVAIGGHDLGGPVAVHWAMTRPDRVRSVALLNTLLYPEFSAAVRDFVAALMNPTARDALTSAEGLAEIMRLGVSDPAVITDAVIAAVAAPFDSDQARATLAKAGYGLGIRGFVEIASGLGSLSCPVTVVYGTADRILPDVGDTFERLRRDVPHASITPLPGCGHFVPEEAPVPVAGLLARFFAEP